MGGTIIVDDVYLDAMKEQSMCTDCLGNYVGCFYGTNNNIVFIRAVRGACSTVKAGSYFGIKGIDKNGVILFGIVRIVSKSYKPHLNIQSHECIICGEVGSYYDVVEQIAKSHKIADLINLTVQEAEIIKALKEARFTGYRFEGSLKWIACTLDILRGF